MINENQEDQYPTNNPLRILLGVAIGGLAGAVTMLLLAPQSGKDTRKQIQKKSIELRDQATEMVDETIAQARSGVDRITLGGRKKIKELKLHGQDFAVEQLDHVSEAAQAGKTAIQSTAN
jgi:gas vesicle protein